MSFRAFRGSRTIPPVLIAAIVFGIAAGIGAFCRFEYGDPAKTCTLCHEIRGSKERWAKSPHKGVNCKECHGGTLEAFADKLEAACIKTLDDGIMTKDLVNLAEGIETKVLGNWVCDYCATHPVDQATSQGEPFATYMYTLFLPEVCVDTKTGKVTVEKFTCVADVGTIMNKLLVDGNFYGGLAQGIGLALTEDFEDLSKHTSLKNCGIPYPKDIPDDIELHYLQTYRPNGPYGAAGCGEAPLDAPHPAILNAIYNATGARITRIPALPEVVLAALAELK